jgi:hypothetical protein
MKMERGVLAAVLALSFACPSKDLPVGDDAVNKKVSAI